MGELERADERAEQRRRAAAATRGAREVLKHRRQRLAAARELGVASRVSEWLGGEALTW